MVQWWSRHHECFVDLSEGDKWRIEDLTGRIPLFLATFLQYPGKPLATLEPWIWDNAPLASVNNNTIRFAKERQRDLGHRM